MKRSIVLVTHLTLLKGEWKIMIDCWNLHTIIRLDTVLHFPITPVQNLVAEPVQGGSFGIRDVLTSLLFIGRKRRHRPFLFLSMICMHFIGCCKVNMEIDKHKINAFTVESLQYCKYSDTYFVLCPVFFTGTQFPQFPAVPQGLMNILFSNKYTDHWISLFCSRQIFFIIFFVFVCNLMTSFVQF